MPLNEAAGMKPRRTLTKEQIREAEAACRGVPTIQSMFPQANLTPDQMEQLRAILNAHDASKSGPPKEFDLNKPPQEPYRFKEFPKLVYRHDTREHKAVPNAAEEKRALDAGWKTEAYFRQQDTVAGPSVEESEAEEIARLDALAKKPKGTKS